MPRSPRLESAEPPIETVLVVHGTFAAAEGGEPQWWQPGGSFCNKLDKRLEVSGHPARTWAHLEHFGGGRVQLEPFSWNGLNSEVERRRAAEELAAQLRELDSRESVGRIHLVAHSHGGSVVAHALRRCGRSLGKLGTVLFLGTPFLRTHRNAISRWLLSFHPPLLVVSLGTLAWGLHSWLGRGERPHIVVIGAFIAAVVGQILYKRERPEQDEVFRRKSHAILLRDGKTEIDEAFVGLKVCLQLAQPGSELRQRIDRRLRRSVRFSLQLSGRLLGWSSPFRFLLQQLETLTSDAPPMPVGNTDIWRSLLQLLHTPPLNLWKLPASLALLAGLLLVVPFWLVDVLISCVHWLQQWIAARLTIRAIPNLARSIGLGDDALGETIVRVDDRPSWHCSLVELPEEVVTDVQEAMRDSLGKSAGQVVRKLNELTFAGLETGIDLAFDGIVHCSYYQRDAIIAKVAEIIAGRTGSSNRR